MAFCHPRQISTPAHAGYDYRGQGSPNPRDMLLSSEFMAAGVGVPPDPGFEMTAGSGARRGSNRGSSLARGNLPVAARFGIPGSLLADDGTSTEVLVAGTRLRVLLTALVVRAQ